MDNEKDSYIKSVLKKDELISKKADDVFNQFLKGEINNMKDVNDNNVVNFNVTKDKKSIFRKRILATAASIMVIFFSANVYAVTQGYNNVFFMIKDMAVKNDKEITDKKEILSDSDLTISYDFINISDELRLQIKKLITKDNEGNLYIDMRGNEDSQLPKEYIVYDITNENDKRLLGKLEDNEENDYNPSQFDGIIKLKSITDNTKKLQLEINDSDSKNVAVVNIDLTNKEIQVISSEASQSHLEKLSEVELKKFLGKYVNFNYYKDYSYLLDYEPDNVINEIKVGVAMDIYSDYYYDKYPNTQDMPFFPANEIHKIIKEMLGEDITEPITKFYGSILYNSEKDEYELQDYGDGAYDEKVCIEISDIKYSNGIYTVTFIYTHETEDSIYFNELADEMELFKTTMKIKLNDDYKYTKYCVVDMDWTSEDSEKISGNTDEFLNQDDSKSEVSILTDESVKDLSEMTIVCPDGWGFENFENRNSEISAAVRGQIFDYNDNSVDTEMTIYKSILIGDNEMEYIEELERIMNCQYNGNFLTHNGDEEWTQLTRYPEDDTDNSRYDIYLHFYILEDGQIVCHRIDMESRGNISELTMDIEQTALDFIENVVIY